MNYVGIDLHKKTIVLCVMNQDLKALHRKTLACGDTDAILDQVYAIHSALTIGDARIASPLGGPRRGGPT